MPQRKPTPAVTNLPGWPKLQPVLSECSNLQTLADWMRVELKTQRRAFIVKRIHSRMRAVQLARDKIHYRAKYGITL